jgi:hypothetical protein
MRKYKAYLFCLYTGLLLAGALVGLGALLRHEPHFYLNREIDAGEDRKRSSSKFVNDFLQLLVNVKENGRDGWHFKFTENDVNSFFQEDFINFGEADNLRKLGVSDPRVAFDQDCIRFAFRYGSGFWSTIVSYDLRVWAVPKEPNVLAVEIRRRRAGALPISSQALVNELAEIAARHNIEVTSYRYEGNPVALIRFQADQPRPTAQLKCLRVGLGELRIGGGKERPPAAN